MLPPIKRWFQWHVRQMCRRMLRRRSRRDGRRRASPWPCRDSGVRVRTCRFWSKAFLRMKSGLTQNLLMAGKRGVSDMTGGLRFRWRCLQRVCGMWRLPPRDAAGASDSLQRADCASILLTGQTTGTTLTRRLLRRQARKGAPCRGNSLPTTVGAAPSACRAMDLARENGLFFSSGAAKVTTNPFSRLRHRVRLSSSGRGPPRHPRNPSTLCLSSRT